MNGSDQRAYDRGITIFSPDGRLYQVEYAREAVKQGSPVVGVRGEDAVALAAHAPRRSPLVEGRSVEKLHAVDDRVAVASAGHAADARRLVDIARRSAQGERLRYGEPATVESLSTTVADHVQEHTQTGGARPYGTALLFAGVDDELIPPK
jgi:proteasome alpha subunit